MSFFKNIKFELIFFTLITLNILISTNFDLNFNNFFIQFKSFESDFLKNFFVNITILGNSIWYFIISIFFLFTLFCNKKMSFIKIKNIDEKINFFVSSLIYLISVGLLTQVLKHLVGRARPNHTNYESGLNFDFLTFESGFHSFPSGHSSTIFTVCFVLCYAMPKLKYYFFILASVVAFSRVVVGAHFLTDVIAGLLLALMVIKILNRVFEIKFDKLLIKQISFQKYEHLSYIVIFFIGLCLFTSVAPTIDLYVASLFYLGESQFFLQSYHLLSILFRDVLIPIILIYVLVGPLVGKFFDIKGMFLGFKFSIGEIILIWSSQIFSLLVFINLLLKNTWGRARPDEVINFGGDNIFTPWYAISQACETNCSFVSGDASVGFGMVILYMITKKIIFIYASLFFGLTLGFIRILAGGHFLSDILFAGLFVFLLNVLIYMIYEKYYTK
tara:strand:+ start:173 stop:1504 length:1332 start_codon:yes stop_codon:yes gene_type:complete